MSEWQPMEAAPRDSTWIDAELPDGSVERVHWAFDYTGECQPPFEAWFKASGDHFSAVPTPIRWKPLINTFDVDDTVFVSGIGEGVVTGIVGAEVTVRTKIGISDFHCSELTLLKTADPEYMV